MTQASRTGDVCPPPLAKASYRRMIDDRAGRYIHRFHRVAVGLILVVALTAHGQWSVAHDAGLMDETAEEWLGHVRNCLKDVFSIRARFIQETKHKLAHPVTDELRGIVEVRRGGRVRLEYKTPARRLLVTDGKTMWAFDPAAKTVITGSPGHSALSGVFALLVDGMDNTAFTASHIGGATKVGDGLAVIELVPSVRDPLVKSIVLTLDKECPCIKRVMIADHAGAVIRVTLENLRLNVGIGARRFRFVPPPGIRVVRP